VHRDDVVLEIGAGVGRVGAELAPLCKRWIGADVSENMLSYLHERLREHANVEAVSLNGWDLSPIDSESVDVVYATVVFMHLDDWDRYGYIREGLRVLKPGGRMYVDNTNLLSEPGWERFLGTQINTTRLGDRHISANSRRLRNWRRISSEPGSSMSRSGTTRTS
jgi:ubiquinone/menaquinone biosynthesis C-methylase UbiE